MSMKKKKRPVLGYLPINTSLDNSINTNNSLNVSDEIPTHSLVIGGQPLEFVLTYVFQTTKSSTDRNDSSLYIPQSPSANAELSTTLNSTLVSSHSSSASDWLTCS